MDIPLASAIAAGGLAAWLVGHTYYPLMFAAFAAEEKAAPPPPPAPEPERDPGWCHSHGTHRDNEDS